MVSAAGRRIASRQRRLAKRRGIEESRVLGLASQRANAGRVRNIVFSYNFSDVITSQTYLTFYGMIAKDTKPTAFHSQTSVKDTQQAVTPTTQHIAQIFTVGVSDIYLDEITIWSDNATGTDDIYVEIRNVSGGEPGTEVLFRKTDTVGTAAPGAEHTVSGENFKLFANTSYALVVTAAVGEWSSDIYYNGSTGGGDLWITTDSEANWAEDANGELWYRIMATTSNPHVIVPASGFTSDDATTSFAAEATADLTLLNLNFDFEVQQSIALKGQAYLTIDSSVGYETINLIKYNGTSETVLATATTESANLVKLNIATVKSIKRGDILRLNIIIKASDTSPGAYILKHNGSDLILNLPVKLVGEI